MLSSRRLLGNSPFLKLVRRFICNMLPNLSFALDTNISTNHTGVVQYLAILSIRLQGSSTVPTHSVKLSTMMLPRGWNVFWGTYPYLPQPERDHCSPSHGDSYGQLQFCLLYDGRFLSESTMIKWRELASAILLLNGL